MWLDYGTCVPSQKENSLENVVNSSAKITSGNEVRLTQGMPWWAQANKAIALPVPFAKQMLISEVQFHQISYWAGEKMWVGGNGVQQVRLWVVSNGIWYKRRDGRGKRVKNAEETQCREKPAQVTETCPETRQLVPTYLPLNHLIVTMTFHHYRLSCGHNTRADTGTKQLQNSGDILAYIFL